jgi:DNA topoisomerase-1
MPPKFFKKTYKKVSDKTSPHLSTATYLIIVESPSKCAKIESYLGPDYCCIASKGHIRSIDGIKSIDMKKTYEPTFSIIDEKKAHVEQMKTIVSNFSKQNIILASDDDREGEAIAWHICKIFDLPIETTKRIIFHEVTKPAIQKSIENPTTVNMDLVHAQHARQVLDIIVGYKISPFLWKYLYNNKSNSLSAGRCQTPALRLV